MDFWEQICCVLSYKMSFEVFSPIWSRVKENEKKLAKNPKFEISTIFVQVLVEALPISMHDFCWCESVM